VRCPEQGADGLSVSQLLSARDILEILVCVVALQLGHLTWLTIAEEDELEGVETKDGGIVEHLVIHAIIKIAEKQRTVLGAMSR
jgi:hypothetical protein